MLGIFPGLGVNVLLSFLFSKLRDLLFCFSCKWYLEIRSRGAGLSGKKKVGEIATSHTYSYTAQLVALIVPWSCFVSLQGKGAEG